MTKKQIMLKLSAYKIAIVIMCVCLLAGGLAVVKAGAYFDWGNVEDKVADRIVGEMLNPEAPPEQKLGAVASEMHMGKLICANDDCTYHIQQDFKAATTTIISIPNPFRVATSSAYGPADGVVIYTDGGGKKYTGATSTVEMARYITSVAATTTYELKCGASTVGTGATVPSYNLIGSNPLGITTGTMTYIENGATNSFGAAIATTSTPKILLTPTAPYFTCVVTPVVSTAITGSNRGFAGKIMLRISRTRM